MRRSAPHALDIRKRDILEMGKRIDARCTNAPVATGLAEARKR